MTFISFYIICILIGCWVSSRALAMIVMYGEKRELIINVLGGFVLVTFSAYKLVMAII